MKIVQRWLLWLMLACYVLAGVFPAPGEKLRGLTLPISAGGRAVTVSMVLLAVMLFSAGLGVRVADLRAVVSRPVRLVLGLAANAVLPLLVLPVVALGLRAWPDTAEAEGLAVGLMLVLAMPIAGGAASWGQNAGANVPLIVAMVMGSALLSPLTIPLGMQLAGVLVGPDGASVLDDTSAVDLIARTGAGAFALVSVVVPCLAGIAVRAALGEARTRRLLPTAKAVNLLNILLLCYLNAAGALGQALAHPDPDLLVLALGLSGAVCCLAFACGRWMARWTGDDQPERLSLTFATGMNNSSAAAVLAAGWFSHRPEVLLPTLSYSLLRKLVAGTAGKPPRPKQKPPSVGPRTGARRVVPRAAGRHARRGQAGLRSVRRGFPVSRRRRSPLPSWPRPVSGRDRWPARRGCSRRWCRSMRPVRLPWSCRVCRRRP